MGQHVGTHRFSMSYPRFVVVEAQTGRPTTLWPCLPPLGMIFSLACQVCPSRMAYGSARGNSQIFYELPPSLWWLKRRRVDPPLFGHVCLP